MSDYIERVEAQKRFCLDCKHQEHPCEHKNTCQTLRVLKKVQSADVAPVRHGRWEATEWAVNRSGAILIGRIYRCSECGRIIDLEHGETLDDYPYCHCGAKMDGEVIKNE